MRNTVAVKEYRNDKLVAVYSKIALLADKGFDPSTVRKVINGERRQHNGSTFREASREDIVNIRKATGRADFGRLASKSISNKNIRVS